MCKYLDAAPEPQKPYWFQCKRLFMERCNYAISLIINILFI